jgi:RNA polymerase sigma factor (sigma-70 family)
MDEHDDWLAERFEANRSHLRAVAYRMLGSQIEADDAVQDAWLRFSRSDADSVENLRGWLTTIVARSCLDILRSRRSRREDPLGSDLPDPIASHQGRIDPEHEALLADSVGPALIVVLETLTPTERLAFVLHDMFAVPFDEIAQIVGRSPAAARQLASRARRRVQGATTVPHVDLTRQREAVDAFLAASQHGDFAGLVALLDPDIVLRIDRTTGPRGATRDTRGAPSVAKRVLAFSRQGAHAAQPALVNGAVGIVVAPSGQLFAALTFTVTRGKIVEIHVITDPERLHLLDLAVLDA